MYNSATGGGASENEFVASDSTAYNDSFATVAQNNL